MSASTTVTKSAQQFTANLLTFSSAKKFEQVIADFEKQLGNLDQEKATASSDMEKTVSAMEGATGLMIVAVLAMDQLLPSLKSSTTRAIQYLVGNPLIASEMTQHHTLASLYAPPRVLIYTEEGKTLISYEQPSSLFGRLESAAVLETAKSLDHKFEMLAEKALSL